VDGNTLQLVLLTKEHRQIFCLGYEPSWEPPRKLIATLKAGMDMTEDKRDEQISLLAVLRCFRPGIQGRIPLSFKASLNQSAS
jgi:hypothetical protein